MYMWYLLMLVPIIFPALIKLKFNSTINLHELFVTVFGTIIIVSGIYFAGTYSATYDNQLYNGLVISKNQITKECNTHWSRWSDSFCTEEITRSVYDGTTCSGSGKNRVCTAHYHTEYKCIYPWERKWYVQTTLREFMIDRVDRQGAKEPPRWTKVNKNDPVSVEKSFVNYIKAVPDSIFNGSMVKSKYDAQIPGYPSVFDYYNVNRVLAVGVPYTENLQKLNFILGQMIGAVGPVKKANINFIVTNISDESYYKAVENKWISGKINDVTIIVGLAEDKKTISWVEVMTYARNKGNGIFVSTMKDEVGSVGNLEDPVLLTEKIRKVILAHFDRPQEKDFEYLKDSVQPATWVIVLAVIIEFAMVIGCSILFHKNEFRFFEGNLFTNLVDWFLIKIGRREKKKSRYYY